MNKPLIQIVDENDQPLYGTTKQEAWDHGLTHRIARIMIEDENGMILLQLRDKAKWFYPNCYDPAVAGHVDEGEDYLTAAKREMAEEIGVPDLMLEQVSYYRRDFEYKGKQMHRFVTLYRATMPHDTALTIAEDEVAGMRWVSRGELDDLIHNQPEIISDGLQEAYDILYKDAA